MGAQEFKTKATDSSPADAFDRVVSQAKYEYGHRGYTGTIAEKSEFVLVPCDAVQQDEAFARAGTLMDADDQKYCDKYGPCGCIEIKTDGSERTFLFFGVAAS